MGEHYPQFVPSHDPASPVTDELSAHYLTRLFKSSEGSLRSYGDRQIACGLWELGPGESHCATNRDIPIERRERLVSSVETFFLDFFNKRCVPKLSHLDRDQTEPLNGICYMWWEVITWGWAGNDPEGERLAARDLDVMEAVLRLDNPACKEAALHGLGHMAGRGGRALAIIDKFLDAATDQSSGLAQYARAARTGCIQ